MSTEISKITDQVAMLQSVVLKLIEAPLARRKHTLDELLSMRDMIKEGKITKVKKITEPAPCSDAEHPPVGYRIAGKSEKRPEHYLFWNDSQRCIPHAWSSSDGTLIGQEIEAGARIAVPIPANEGDSRLAESVAIPVGWKECCFFDHANSRAFGGTFIAPDPSIPWGEGYEAILPSEATYGDEHNCHGFWMEVRGPGTSWMDARHDWAWRRRIPATTPTEPARDLSDKIAESVVQDLQQACHDRDELRATVERMEAELETTKRLLAESLVERDRLKNLHDARKVRIEGFRDVLRERLGDLV